MTRMRIRRAVAILGAAAGAAALLHTVRPQAQAPAFDLVIRNGRIVDGTGSPWFVGDIAVRGDTIAAVAPHVDPRGARTVDAAGLIVAPGFIDVHSHSESAQQGLAAEPAAENNVRQGVTTVFGNPDGGGDVPIAPFLGRVAAAHPAINLGAFIGHGSVRAKIIGNTDRAATAAELDQMRALVRVGMDEGAFGLSTGLFYVPGNYAPLSEVIELARVAGERGGIHQSHMRDEAAHVLDSVRDTIAIGEQGHLPTQVTHHKIIGKAYWGRSVDTLRLVDEARARGVDVTIDQYPYTASSTSVQAALMPAWAQEGGTEAVLKRLNDPATHAKIRAESMDIILNARGGGDPHNVQIARCEWDMSLAGKRLDEVTAARGLPATLENAAETVLWIVQQGGCQGIFHAISEEDLQRILKHPATMIGSDGEVPIFGEASPHPRSYGTFARVLGRYVRDLTVITLEDAVRKMSSFPAQRIGLGDRGVLREGMKADIAIFDPATVADKATFEQPHQYAVGVSTVIVNGQVAFENGKMTAARPGKTLYGPARK